MKEITITKREEGQRFDKFLCKYLPGASSGFLHKMLRKKNIKLNGKKAEGKEKLTAGDLIQIFFSDETLEKFQSPQNRKDESYNVYNKNESTTGSVAKNLRSGKMLQQNSGAGNTQASYGKEVTERTKRAGTTRNLTKAEQELRKQVRVLYSSEDILVFHKPAGMLSQRAKASDDSLNDYLIDYCIKQGIISREELAGFRPSIANRLDRNTSGIVLAGISIKGLQRLASMLRERTLGKYYLCLVEGRVKEDARIAGYLTKEEKNNKVSLHKEKVEGASYIETEYKVLRSTDKASLLKIRLITGKSHQIRGHLASVGHPVFGDYKYGNRDFNNQIKWKDGINYQLLHSYELVVPEGTGELSGLHIIDPVPWKFHKVQQRWGLEVPEVSYENEAENTRTGRVIRKTAENIQTGKAVRKATENTKTGRAAGKVSENTRTGKTANKRSENARTEKNTNKNRNNRGKR